MEVLGDDHVATRLALGASRAVNRAVEDARHASRADGRGVEAAAAILTVGGGAAALGEPGCDLLAAMETSARATTRCAKAATEAAAALTEASEAFARPPPPEADDDGDGADEPRAEAGKKEDKEKDGKAMDLPGLHADANALLAKLTSACARLRRQVLAHTTPTEKETEDVLGLVAAALDRAIDAAARSFREAPDAATALDAATAWLDAADAGCPTAAALDVFFFFFPRPLARNRPRNPRLL